MTNDIASASFLALNFEGPGHSVSGNSIVITGTILGGTSFLNVPITLGVHQTWSAGSVGTRAEIQVDTAGFALVPTVVARLHVLALNDVLSK